MAHKVFQDSGNTLPSSAEKGLESTVNYHVDNFKPSGSGSPLTASYDQRPSSDDKMSVEPGSLPSINNEGRVREVKYG